MKLPAASSGVSKRCKIGFIIGGHLLFPPKPLFCMLSVPQAVGVLKIIINRTDRKSDQIEIFR